MVTNHRSKITNNKGEGKRLPTFVFKPRNEVNYKQSEFLSNNNNKTALIKALALKLRAIGHVVVECEGDANRTIAKKGIEVARERKSANVVADDTDILFMLVHMWDQTMGDLFLRHEAKKSIKKDLEIISIKNVQSSLPSHVKENLLFIHA